MFGYVTQLRSLSSGRATSTMEFSHYSPAPNNIAEEVIAKVKGKSKKLKINSSIALYFQGCILVIHPLFLRDQNSEADADVGLNGSVTST